MKNEKDNDMHKCTSKKNKEERGIALIMTLGILSMLLVLALAFASNARTDRKAAAANAHNVQARLLAESGMQRVVALAQYYNDIASNGPEIDRDWIHNLSTTDYFGTELFPWKKDEATLTENSNIEYGDINWEYITTPIDENNDSIIDYNEIIGRIAYIFIPEDGIDPAALIESGVNEDGANEIRLGVSLTEINIASLNDQTNESSNPNDPNYTKTIYLSFLNNGVQIQDFSWDNAGGKYEGSAGATWGAAKPNGLGWDGGFTVMFDSSHMNITAPDYQNALKSWFVDTPTPSKEGFWIDHNANDEKDDDELYHRFNLTRTNWDNFDPLSSAGNDDADVMAILDGSSTVDGLTAPDNSITAPEYPWVWEKDGTADGSGADSLCDGNIIPWLSNWKEKGTFTTAQIRAKQIAANLIDYCDEDDDNADGDNDPTTNPVNIPTSDVNPTTWNNSNTPTYTGNEKTPYINEIGITVNATFDVAPIGTVPETYTRTVDMSFDIEAEIINIYDENLSGPITVTIYGLKFNGKYMYGTGNYNGTSHLDPNISLTSPLILTFANNIVANSYTSKSVNAAGKDYFFSGSASDSVGLIDPVITIDKVVLSYNGKNVDYSSIDVIIPAPASPLGDCGGQITTGSNTTHTFFSFQTKDPRQNLNPGDWNSHAILKQASTVTYGDGTNSPEFGTYETVNYQADPSASGKDSETGLTDPALGISTAYIANEPMMSPWELGAIHRGAAWETINLKNYNTTEKTTGGGSDYASGDANILDQIKMTNATESPMKVAFQLQAADDILYALLNKIRIGATWIDIGTTGNQITGGDVSNVVSAIKGATLTTRASVANVIALYDGTCGETQDTDAEQEELIGKFINLTAVGTTTTSTSDFFTAIVLAQSIKDIGGNGTTTPIYKDLDGDGTVSATSTANEVTAGYLIDGVHNNSSGTDKYNSFDDFIDNTSISEKIDAQLGVYDQYADEIVGEQKIKASFLKDPTSGKIKIISYEYLND